MKTILLPSLALAVALLTEACAFDPGSLTGGPRKGSTSDQNTDADGTDPNAPGEDPGDPKFCTSREYMGFADAKLTEGRTVARLGMDRSRVKPFTALQTEFTRVLGTAPASLQGAGATFGQVPKNWFEEPQSNAVALQTAYSIAFDGCLTYTETAPEFAAIPDAANAPIQCAAMIRKFWSKTAGPHEINSCTSMATTHTAAEPQARRKWAYACASVLTSAGFLSY